ncbi:MAG: AAA family ATPase [Gammaproteobacteria bacterium]|nr:MAG: AAA family ATPase [Gammaproteobacteria bacterium]
MHTDNSALAPELATAGETATTEQAVGNRLQRVQQEISKAVIGQSEVIEQVLIAMLTGGHVLLEGVPGLGKTLLVKALAKTFGGHFSRIQFTPDLMPADVTGHMFYHPKEGSFTLRHGPVFTNLLLADEINRAPAKTQSALLEVMQEKQVTIEGESLEVGNPFMVLATQNPLEQEGTYPLPEAQLDRFLMKISIEHLTQDDERLLMQHVLSLPSSMQISVGNVDQLMTGEDLLALQQAVNQVIVDERVLTYAVNIVRQTREFSGISVGAGPRGAIALLSCARAKALMQGRGHVIPDDVKSLALPVLRHRIALTAEAEIEGLSADHILRQLLETIDAPRQ